MKRLKLKDWGQHIQGRGLEAAYVKKGGSGDRSQLALACLSSMNGPPLKKRLLPGQK